MNFSMIDLFLQASLFVKCIMVFLILASVFSWAIIFDRMRQFRKVAHEIRRYHDHIWTHQELEAIADRCRRNGAYQIGVFELVAKLSSRAKRQTGDRHTTDKALNAQANRVIDAQLTELSKPLGWLATIGSTTPYIGLLGTVWGIMHAFISLGSAKNATLQMVAPGIAEALIATAFGLIAAIPAVIAYNRYSNRLDWLEQAYLGLAEDMIPTFQVESISKNSAPNEAATV